MKKMLFTLFSISLLLHTTLVFAELTEAQKAEQRKQQQAAQRAYQASADTHNEVSRKAGTYKEGAEIIRDSVKEVGEHAVR
ncbi:hypothetical protein ACFL3J_03035 [Candidatus Omnitrophota bacterium]